MLNLLKIIKNLFADYKENKTHYIVNCPSCGREKLYIDKKENLFICFRCGIKGTLAYLVRYVLNCNLEDANAYIFGERRIKSSEERGFFNKIINSLFDLDQKQSAEETFIDYYTGTYKPIEYYKEDSEPIQYLESRGISLDKAMEFDLGYSEVSKRLIFPVFYDYNLVGYQARDITDTQTPKILSSKTFQKSKYLYGYDLLDKSKDTLIICEGPVDVIKASKFNAVGLFGKYLSKEQFNLILALGFKKIYIGLDKDTHSIYSNGEIVNLAKQMADQFSCFVDDVCILDLNEGKDLGDMEEEEIEGYLSASDALDKYMSKITIC